MYFTMKVATFLICILATCLAQEDEISSRLIGTAPERVIYSEVYLFDYITNRTCTGVLIDPVWVLTSGECASIAKSLRYLFGAEVDPLSLSSSETGNHYVYPQYNSITRAHDIALINLVTPAPASIDEGNGPVFIGSKPIARFDNRVYAGTTASVSGYGRNGNADEADGILRERTVTILDNKVCQLYANTVPLSIYKLCSLGAYACAGDEGSPLISGNEIIGIVSTTPIHTETCGTSYAPIISYTFVPPYLTWMRAVMRRSI